MYDNGKGNIIINTDVHLVFGLCSSSESDMEEEDEEDEEHQPGPSDLGGVPWKEAVEIHAKLKGDSDGETPAEGTQNGLGPRAHAQEDGEMEEDVEEGEEEEEDEEEEDEEEDESSDGKTT